MNANEFELCTLELKGVQPPKPKSRSFKRLRRRPTADTVPITIDAISSEEGNLSIEISLPNEYHFSKVHIDVFSFKTHTHMTIIPWLPPLKFHCRKLAVDSVLILNLKMLWISILWMDYLVRKDLQCFTLRDPLILLQWEELVARYDSFWNPGLGWILIKNNLFLQW